MSTIPYFERPRTVTIVGGGIAGMSAAVALAQCGLRVQLVEARGYLGGRASSYLHAGTGEVLDNCQHALFGCCTNLIDFYQRIGAADKIAWHRQMTMVEPGGRQSMLGSLPLPAPAHGLPRLLSAHAFSTADKLSLMRAFTALLFAPVAKDSRESLAEWLERHGQSRGALRRFWWLVIASALNADLDQIAMPYAAKVIRELFMNSAQAGAMGLSKVPLSELYGGVEGIINQAGGTVHFNRAITAGAFNPRNMQWCLESREEIFESDDLILALPFQAMKRLLPMMPHGGEGMGMSHQPGESIPSPIHLRHQLEDFRHWPIVSIHLWFDRAVTELDHAILLDREWHWMYNQSRLQQGRGGHYIELLSSASETLAVMKRAESLELALKELAEFFPKVREAKLEKFALIKEIRATFGVPPGIDSARSSPLSPWRNCYMAGDWTDTGWPSTMESAARSGYLAAEALAHNIGAERKFLVRDLKPQGIMRLFRG